MQGKVKFYHGRRGFGFIECPELGKDVFYHITKVIDGSIPAKGEQVEFETMNSEKGIMAVDVKIIG